ncbi:MAG TPA: hypothetical protein VLM40_04185, partial [Gemmata sp.]|nr:hypothetical protein [Gemmata sp.]
NDIRSPMSQDFNALRNALYYPKSLLSAINAGDTTTELRPYTSSFGSLSGDEIPNANGATDPNTGLAYGYNLLSPSSSLPTSTYGTVKGRRGARKVLIFETDGVPNSYRTATLTKLGYDSYYPTLTSGASPGNGDSTSMSRAVTIVQQIVKPMATNNSAGVDSGMTLPNAPALVYPIGFGDIFDPVASPSATFRPTAISFLNSLAAAGNTVSLQSDQLITGNYQTRITNLKNVMERIFTAGVAVSLVE